MKYVLCCRIARCPRSIFEKQVSKIRFVLLRPTASSVFRASGRAVLASRTYFPLSARS